MLKVMQLKRNAVQENEKVLSSNLANILFPELERSAKALPHDWVNWISRSKEFHNQKLIEGHLLSYLYFVLPLLHLALRKSPYKFFKRCMEFSFSLVALIGFLPFFALVALAIKMESPGPIFFRQLRMGFLGKPFWIYKFRTMTDGAELKNANVIPLHKNQDDPRVTRFGKFMRKFKVDELPQILNVIRGDMSLIGPRPLSVDESLVTPARYLPRYAVLPGMSGLWQAFRPDLNDGVRKMRFDVVYARNMSFWMDFNIFFATFKVFVRGENFTGPPPSVVKKYAEQDARRRERLKAKA